MKHRRLSGADDETTPGTTIETSTTSAAELRVREASKQRMSFQKFLTECPPGDAEQHISELVQEESRGAGRISYVLATPAIRLHCGEDVCGGMMIFRSTDNAWVSERDVLSRHFISYMCSNCQTTSKTFALEVRWDGKGAAGSCRKLGESPAYGPPTPSRLIFLIGPDKEDFLKGRRCENQGLGIGAFAYYRRIVENQKNRISKRNREGGRARRRRRGGEKAGGGESRRRSSIKHWRT